MYAFFRATTGIEATRLIDPAPLMALLPLDITTDPDEDNEEDPLDIDNLPLDTVVLVAVAS